MIISAELFQCIVQSVRADDGSDRIDKRRVPRSDFTGKAQIIPPGANAPVDVIVRDLSVQGIGLLHSSAIKAGQQFTLVLTDATSDGYRGVICTVARWQPVTEKLCLIGAKFTGTVADLGAANPDDVAALQSRLRSAGLY